MTQIMEALAESIGRIGLSIALICASTVVASAGSPVSRVAVSPDQMSTRTDEPPTSEKPAPILPGTQKEVLAPPATGDAEMTKGTPPGTDFPTPVIRPPTTIPAPTPTPAPAR